MRNEKEIGAIIRELRGDVSLRDFANKCDISHTTIDNLEKGVDFRTGKPVQVKITTLQKIADACGVSLSYIIDEEEKTSVNDELKVALFGGGTEVTDEMWEMVMDYAKLVKSQYEQRKEEKKRTMETAARLRLAMKKKDIFTPELADVSKIDKAKIADFIDGVCVPSDKEASSLATALTISADWLLGKKQMPLDVALLQGEDETISDEKWDEVMEYAKILEGKYK